MSSKKVTQTLEGAQRHTCSFCPSADDFEVSVFLTEITTRHSLLVKNKTFNDKAPIKSNSSKLTGSIADTIVVNEDSDEETSLDRIPAHTGDDFEEIEKPDGQDFRDNAGSILDDDKKKLGFKTTYEGFSIWGWVLCLIVERKGGPGKKEAGNAQALMQEWIASTQQAQDDDG